LQRCPKVNAINEGEVAQSVASVDISVAVATEGGLITPITILFDICVMREGTCGYFVVVFFYAQSTITVISGRNTFY